MLILLLGLIRFRGDLGRPSAGERYPREKKARNGVGSNKKSLPDMLIS